MKVEKSNACAHVVFDNDGTLVDSEDNFLMTLKEILPKYLNREVSIEEILQNYIPDWKQLLINFGMENPGRDLIDSIIDDVVEFDTGYIPPLFPGMKDIICKLNEMNIATYIWTGREKKSAIEILNFHGLTELFEEMMFMDSSIPKPNPDGLNKMLGDIDKDKIVMIGDSTVDLEGANNFDIPCLIVDWKNNVDHKESYGFGASKVVRSPDEIIAWVKVNLINKVYNY